MDNQPVVKAMRVTMPSCSLLDPAFKYVPACKTDLKETFRRARAARRLLPVLAVPEVLK